MYILNNVPNIIYIDIPTFSGEYTVQCITDDGSVFSGTVEF